MDRQKSIQNLDVERLKLSDLATFNLFSVYFLHITDLHHLPYIISDTFLDKEENINVVCQVIMR